MSILPRLYYLVGFAPYSTHDAYRVFHRDVGYIRKGYLHKKYNRFLLPVIDLLLPEPSRSTYREVVTWRVCDHHIPIIVKMA